MMFRITKEWFSFPTNYPKKSNVPGTQDLNLCLTERWVHNGFWAVTRYQIKPRIRYKFPIRVEDKKRIDELKQQWGVTQVRNGTDSGIMAHANGKLLVTYADTGLRFEYDSILWCAFESLERFDGVYDYKFINHKYFNLMYPTFIMYGYSYPSCPILYNEKNPTLITAAIIARSAVPRIEFLAKVHGVAISQTTTITQAIPVHPIPNKITQLDQKFLDI